MFISAHEEIRLNRLMLRNNLTKEEAKLRMDAQGDEVYKIQHSDYVIYNDSDI